MQLNKNTEIAIVGAGLVGSLLAIYMARKGFQVEMFERRPDMRKEEIGAGRSINLAVSTRGLLALRDVGLEEEVLKYAVPMRGRMIHSRNHVGQECVEPEAEPNRLRGTADAGRGTRRSQDGFFGR